MSNEIEKISGEYSTKLKKRFEENDGKLFLVDYSKSCALRTLKELLAEKQSYRSFLCVVDDREVAREFASVLEPTVGKIEIADTFEKFEKILSSVVGSASIALGGGLKTTGEKFKGAYPNLIVTTRDEETGEELFHKYLCVDSTKNGTFDGRDGVGYFCVSDLLSIFAYEFVVVDNVYEKFAFKEENADENESYPAGRYERIDLLGTAYYTDYTHSFKRLNNVVDAAKKCVLLSDVIVESNAVNLYLALELLYGKFPATTTRELVKGVSDDYEDDCASVCSLISNYNNDEVLGRCMQKLIGCKQKVPGDMYRLADYFTKQFDYSSEEEIFLRVIDCFARTKMKGKLVSIQPVCDRLDNTMELVDCLCEIFFSNEIKAAIESSLSTLHVRKMTEEEIAALFEIFLRYGAYHPYPQDDKRCKVVRLKRDDSAFERYVRDYVKEREDDEYTYSILHGGSTLLFKCLTIKRLLEEDASSGCASPMLVVTRGNGERIVETLSKLLPDYDVGSDIDSLTDNSSQKRITVVDYALFRETALWLNVKSATFFDVEYDAILLKNLINKALRYGDVTAYVLADYGDLSGAFADAWQEELLSAEHKAMPIDNSEILVKGGVERIYADAVRQIEEVYCLLSDIVTKGKKKYLAPCAEKFNRLITDFTQKSTVQTQELVSDFGYLAALAKDYGKIFGNCVSVGGAGENVLSEKYHFAKITKTVPAKNPSKPATQVEEIVEKSEEVQTCVCYFNVCLKSLRRNCDFTKKNCNGCKGYDKYVANDFNAFKEGVAGLFEKTLKYAKWSEEERLIEMGGRTISHTESEAEKRGRLLVEEIEAYEKQANVALDKIAKHARKKKLFQVDYELVKEVCSAAEKAYCKLLDKYYAAVVEIFETTTNESKRGFELVNDSFTAAHSGQ